MTLENWQGWMVLAKQLKLRELSTRVSVCRPHRADLRSISLQFRLSKTVATKIQECLRNVKRKGGLLTQEAALEQIFREWENSADARLPKTMGTEG
jgi:hypothetical protein